LTQVHERPSRVWFRSEDLDQVTHAAQGGTGRREEQVAPCGRQLRPVGPESVKSSSSRISAPRLPARIRKVLRLFT
jgi:hypothetical protein